MFLITPRDKPPDGTTLKAYPYYPLILSRASGLADSEDINTSVCPRRAFDTQLVHNSSPNTELGFQESEDRLNSPL
jgi:hypothetical protein